MRKIFILILLTVNFIFSQCTPIEVSTYISEKDAWMFPYSTFYWGMSDGLFELSNTNQECYDLLENNEECINSCMFLDQEENNCYWINVEGLRNNLSTVSFN